MLLDWEVENDHIVGHLGKRQKGRRGIASAAQSFNQQEQTGANGVLMSQWISGE